LVPPGPPDAALDLMPPHPANDTLIFVNGGTESAGGQAPGVDVGNLGEDAGVAGDTVGLAHLLYLAGARGGSAADDFLNFIANVISHEAGHNFGLDHIQASQAEAWGTSLMTLEVGATNLAFTDRTYLVGDPALVSQNA